MILDIRGTNGSGKSTCVKYLLDKYPHSVRRYSSPEGNAYFTHVPRFNLLIVGRYVTQCGGADGVKTTDLIREMVLKFDDHGFNVIVEGSIVSHIFQRWYDASEGRDWIFFHLEPSEEECIRRVTQRRLESGNTKPLNPKNLLSSWRQTGRTIDKLEQGGRTVIRWGDKPDPHLEIESLLEEKTKND